MRKILYFIIILIFISCKKKQEDFIDCQIVKIDLDAEIPSKMPASEQFSFLNLELTDESMLADIAKVIKYNDKLYILSTSEPTVFIFNSSGKFEKKLRQGQGPGEVIFVSDMELYNDTLYILDKYRQIKMYDLGGSYIQDKLSMKEPYFSLCFTSGGMYLFDPNINKKSDYNLRFIANNGDEKSFLPKDKWLKDINILAYNPIYDGFVVWPLSNIIYKVGLNGDVRPAFNFDFNGKWISNQEYKELVTNKEMCDGNLNQYARWIKDFIPLNDGCFWGFKYNEKDYHARYQDNKLTLYSKLLDGLPERHDAAVGFFEKTLIYAYTIDELKEYKEKYEIIDKPIYQQLYKMTEDENSNPVLAFIYIK